MEIIKTGQRDDLGFPVLKKAGEPAPVILPEEDPAAVRARYEGAKFALEAASGGKNTLIFDDLGRPSVMVRIPMFLWSDVLEGAPAEPCSAFVAGGRVLDSIWISKYENVVEYGRAYSLPGRDPAHTLTIDEEILDCLINTELPEHVLDRFHKHLCKQIDTGDGVRILQPQVVVFVDIGVVVAGIAGQRI